MYIHISQGLILNAIMILNLIFILPQVSLPKPNLYLFVYLYKIDILQNSSSPTRSMIFAVRPFFYVTTSGRPT